MGNAIKKRVVHIVEIMAIIIAMLLFVPSVKSEAITRDAAITWLRGMEKRNYDWCDVDGNGLWCTDLVTAWMNYLWLNTNGEGNKEAWSTYPYTTSHAKYYDNNVANNPNWTVITRTSSTVPQPGDIFVSEKDYYNLGYGHVGVVLSANGSTAVSMHTSCIFISVTPWNWCRRWT